MPTASDTDKDKALMDELQKKLAEAQAEAAAHKVRADQAERDRDIAKLDAHEARAEAKTAESEKIRADQAETDLKVANEKIATLTAANTTLTDEVATHKTRADAADAAIGSRVDARIKLLTEATPIIGKNDKGEPVNLIEMNERAIKCAVVLRVDGIELEPEDGKDKPTDEFVNGAYKGAVKRHERAAASRIAVEKDVASMVDSKRDDKKVEAPTGADAEKRGIDKIRNSLSSAWKKSAQKDKE
jgi:hypothetical protein